MSCLRFFEYSIGHTPAGDLKKKLCNKFLSSAANQQWKNVDKLSQALASFFPRSASTPIAINFSWERRENLLFFANDARS